MWWKGIVEEKLLYEPLLIYYILNKEKTLYASLRRHVMCEQKSDKSLKLYCYNIEVSQQHDWANANIYLSHCPQMNVLIKDDGEKQRMLTIYILPVMYYMRRLKKNKLL